MVTLLQSFAAIVLLFKWYRLVHCLYLALPSANIYEELLNNEKKNFNLVTTAVADLGGIPAMIRHVDMSNTIPEEKVQVSDLQVNALRFS